MIYVPIILQNIDITMLFLSRFIRHTALCFATTTLTLHSKFQIRRS